MICPRCKGKKQIAYLSHFAACDVCRGKGTLPATTYHLWEILNAVSDHLSDGHNCGICQDLYEKIEKAR